MLEEFYSEDELIDDMLDFVGWTEAQVEEIHAAFQTTDQPTTAPTAASASNQTAEARPIDGGLFVVVNAQHKCRVLTYADLAKSKICGCIHRIGGSEKQCTLTSARRKSIAKMHNGAKGRCRHHHKRFRADVAVGRV